MLGSTTTYPPAPFDKVKNRSTLGLLAIEDEEHDLYDTKNLRRQGGNSPWNSMTERFSQRTRHFLSLFLSLVLNVVLATYFLRLVSQREDSVVWRGAFPKYSQYFYFYFE